MVEALVKRGPRGAAEVTDRVWPAEPVFLSCLVVKARRGGGTYVWGPERASVTVVGISFEFFPSHFLSILFLILLLHWCKFFTVQSLNVCFF